MNIGALLIALALASAFTSTIAYFLSARGHSRFASLARVSYYYFTVLVLFAAGLLFYYFIAGDYSYKYVYEYSSSKLPFFFLIAAFWGGQQGTYLLWLALLSIFGYYIIFKGKEYTSYAMVFYGLITLFFCAILMVLSPFEKLPIPQPDGAGLNPLLIDPWMVIHPPVMFIGYAAAALPFVIALAALVKNDYRDWLKVTFVPVILASTALAAGNIMGGFWAYKTLGWGGYWGWDPVENSSLVPWMFSLALVHGLILEKHKGALRKTNLFLSLLLFVIVVYGTFLTRSGVLADFSVHSFIDLGVNGLLISFMIGTALLALLLFAFRFLDIKGPTIDLSFTSRQFSLIFAVWVLSLIGVFILSGTSWPLITGLFGHAGAVDISVYPRITFPLAILMGAFLGIAPYTAWKQTAAKELVKKSIASVIVALSITVICFFIGVKSFAYQLYIFTASLALSANFISLLAYFPNKLKKTGPQLAHFGFALMLLGILGSSAYATSEKVVINRNDSATAFNMQITYDGMAHEITTPNNELILSIASGDDTYQARPRLYWSSRMNGMMKKPFIRRKLFYDIYFSPEQIQDVSNHQGVTIAKGDTVQIGSFKVSFKDFDQTSHSTGADMRFGAVLEVIDSLGNSKQIIPSVFFKQGGMQYQDVPLMAGKADYPVRLEHINADDGSIVITVKGLSEEIPADRLVLEISKKPTMNFLWAGTIILVFGCLVALRNRWRKLEVAA